MIVLATLSDGSQFDEISGGAVLALRATAAAVAAAAFDGIEREDMDNEGISSLNRLHPNELRGNKHALSCVDDVVAQGEIDFALLPWIGVDFGQILPV